VVLDGLLGQEQRRGDLAVGTTARDELGDVALALGQAVGAARARVDNPQSVPPCYDFTSHQGVGVTHSDRFTGYEEYGLLTGWVYPSWTSRGQLLRSDPGAILNVDTPWGQNTPVVQPCAELSNPAGGRFMSPTLSPEGHGLAFTTEDGIHMMALPDLSGGCQAAGGERLLIAGASSPDWGPAPVPDPSQTQSQAGGAPTRSLSVAVKRSSLRKALRNGLVVTVRGATGKVTATALKGRTKVGTGRATAKNGTAKVRVRFTRRAKRALAHKRSVRLTIRITAGATRSVNVTLRRA
jgi:hypothetical protein